VNNYFFKNHGSQIETVSVIVHTPITSLFKGAQLMNYAIWVLILLCCAATKCPVRQCFMHCLHYDAKLKQVWVIFYSFLKQMEEKKISIAYFSFRLCWTMSSFYVCRIFLRNVLFKLKRMKKNVKQKAGLGSDSVGNVFWNQCLFFYLQE